MTRKILLTAVVLGGLAAPSAVQAQGIQVTAIVNGVSQTFSFTSQEEALSSLTGPSLAARFPGFVEGSAVTANINNNGQPLNLIVPAGSTTAILVNPITGAAIAVPAQTAGGAINNTRSFFQGNTSVAVPVSSLPASVLAGLPAAQRAALLSAPFLTVTSILQSAVQNTISDPIAGNPTALIPQMVASDFIAGSAPTGGLLGVNQPRADGWRFNIGANIITTTGGGADTRVFTAPLRASYYFGRTGTEIFLDAPMAFVDVGGTNVFQGSAGVGVSYVGERPLPFGEQSNTIFTTDLAANVRFRSIQLGLVTTNLFDRRYRVAEFNYVSDFRSQPYPTLVAARHFTAGEPRAIYGTLTITFGGPKGS